MIHFKQLSNKSSQIMNKRILQMNLMDTIVILWYNISLIYRLKERVYNAYYSTTQFSTLEPLNGMVLFPSAEEHLFTHSKIYS